MEKHLPAMNSVARTAQRAQVCVIAALALFFIFPVTTMVAKYVRPTEVLHALTNSSLRDVWWFTFWQAIASTAFTILVAMPFTWAVSRHSFRFSRALTNFITVPFLMPAVVIATGVRALLPHASVPAILWAHVVFNVAVVVRMVGPQWALLDPTMEDTAADLGAGKLRTFFTVVLPHIRSSLRNATAVVFLFCFTSFAVVAILGGISHRTIESEIFTQAVRLGNTRTATSLALLQAVVVLSVIRLSRVSTSQHQGESTVQSHVAARTSMTVRLATAVYGPVIIVTAPIVAVVLRSFMLNGHFTVNGYRWLFNGSTEAVGINIPHTIVSSLVFAAMCAVIATTAAFIISAARNQTSLVPFITAMPLAISAVTLGLGLIITFNTWPCNWRSQWWLIPIIHSVIALPLALRTVYPALQTLPHDLYEASASLGASPWRTLVRIEIPLLRPALTRAAGFSAAVSLGEFGATSFLSRSGTTTIPIAIGQLLGRPGDVMSQSAFALASLVVVTLVLAPQVRRHRR